MKKKSLILFPLLVLLLTALLGMGSSDFHVSANNPPVNTKITVIDGVHFNGNSYLDNISSDGRYVVFRSIADNHGLAIDTNNGTDIFIYDRVLEDLVLVSKNIAGTSTGNKQSYASDVSDDGNFVVFYSLATDIAPNDMIHCYKRESLTCTDTFLWSRETDTIEKISVTYNGEQSDGESLIKPSISADGSKIVFSSRSNKLSEGDDDYCYDRNCPNLYLYDKSLPGNHIKQLGHTYNGDTVTQIYNEYDISGNGDYVVFSSSQGNFLPDDPKLCNNLGSIVSCSDIFLLDISTNEISLVSKSSYGHWGDNESRYPGISYDGNIISFQSAAENLVVGDSNTDEDIFVYTRSSDSIARISDSVHGHSNPKLSSSGRFVIYYSRGDYGIVPPPNVNQWIRVHDNNLLTTAAAPYNWDGDGSVGAFTQRPFISSDGRFVVFDSSTQKLVEDEPNDNYTDIYLYDREVMFPPKIQFLGLPVEYTGDNPHDVLLGNRGGSVGRVNSWFDHEEPYWQHNLNGETWPWHGLRLSNPGGVGDCTLGLNCYDSHDGTDFQKVSPEDNVVAAADGNVVKLNGLGLGLSVMVNHNNGYATVYGHLDEIDQGWLNATFDNPVPILQGERIGEVGATGSVGCGEHLHFEVRYDPNGEFPASSKVDPFGWSGLGEDPAAALGYLPSPRGGLWEHGPNNFSQSVDETGGVIESSDGKVSIEFPAGALSSQSLWDFTLLPSLPGLPDGYFSTPFTFWFGSSDWDAQQNEMLFESALAMESFDMPAEVEIQYADRFDGTAVGVDGIHEQTFRFVRWDPQSQTAELVLPSGVLTSQNIASFSPTEPGYYALVGKRYCSNDLAEPNNNESYATHLDLGLAETHIFAEPRRGVDRDIDWFKSSVEVGKSYVVSVSDLKGDASSLTVVFNGDEALQINEAGEVEFEAISDEILIKVESQGNTNPVGFIVTCGTTYTVSIAEKGDSKIFLPLINK